MRDAIPEPRTAVMILVDATWEDQSGTLRRERARMENTSNSGACIRVKRQIEVYKQSWRWEEFSGVARYCRKEGFDYLIGIQRDAKKSAMAKKAVAANVSAREGAKSVERNVLVSAVRAEQLAKQEESKPKEIAREQVGSVPIVTREQIVNELTPMGMGQGTSGKGSPGVLQTQGSEEILRNEPQREPALKGKGQERKHMRRKLLDLAHWGNKQNEGKENSNGMGDAGKHAPAVTAVATEKNSAGEARACDESFAGELLSMEEHLSRGGDRGAAPRVQHQQSSGDAAQRAHSGADEGMNRASVLMALDAAG